VSMLSIIPPGISNSTVSDPWTILLDHHQALIGSESNDISPSSPNR